MEDFWVWYIRFQLVNFSGSIVVGIVALLGYYIYRKRRK